MIDIPDNLRHKEAAKLRIRMQELLVRRDQWQACTNCDNWQEKSEECRLFNARPPAYIIVSGCEDHTMKIPF